VPAAAERLRAGLPGAGARRARDRLPPWRAGEAGGSRFDRDAGTLLVRESKSGKPRHVVLDKQAAAFLEALTAGRPGNERIFRRAHLKPAKDKSTERIDGIVALIMALGRAMLPQETAPSYQMFILG
jgi:integrase